jgi:hypothetical protein
VEPGAPAEERGRQLGAGIEKVLAVVEYQEQTAVADRVAERAERIAFFALADAEDPGDSRRDQLAVGDPGELDPHRAFGERLQPPRELACEAGFPAPSGSNQTDQPIPPDRLDQIIELLLSAGEGRQEARHRPPADLGREAIPAARLGHHPAGAVAQGLAETGDLRLQDRLGNELIRPHGVEELALSQQPPGVLDQVAE